MEVKYIDHMGSDLRVVNAARVSFNKEHLEFEDNDKGLINYLAKHNHWTPFSHVQITLREKVSIFVARQRFKHMVGFTYNEVSRRYVDDPPEFYIPNSWRLRSVNAKQGSEGEHPRSSYWMARYLKKLEDDFQLYDEMIQDGVAPEQARMVLPQSMYTEYYVTGSLPAWARAYKLRTDSHAQKEIQELASLWNREMVLIKELEHSWRALTT
jgi:thymidylate synthase (FAD)